MPKSSDARRVVVSSRAQPASSSLTLVAALAQARLWLAAAKAVLSAGAQQTLGPPAPAPFTRFAVVCSAGVRVLRTPIPLSSPSLLPQGVPRGSNHANSDRPLT